ncbi:hypothetical protein NQ317_008642 [Molorchus minor]|uniref:CCDC92/74 N-terminal domain-containing protein n=1 Tax=Molorchus minor TaxID=1323400 RepID=A0ABQ9K0X0_9CUCU|nr:hypothetical protein NQ317_008642 [Molorchus minor]
MASKVMVKIPVGPFGQVNKTKSGSVNGEIVVSRPQDISPRNTDQTKGLDNARVAQLEQNIKFLQEQHQLMLTGLHNEIENVKSRNRVIRKTKNFSSSLSSPKVIPCRAQVPPSSPEDDAKHKVYSSPKTINLTPLQVEILEKELGEVKMQHQEIENRNTYLSAIVDEQKKKLERYERDREKERQMSLQPDPELLRKLDDAETIIRRLRRENSDLRRENAVATGHYQQRETQPHGQRSDNGYNSPRSGGQQSNQGRGNSAGRHRANNGHYRGNWFPPLHTQSYWHGGRSNGERTNGGQVDGAGVLPNLPAEEDRTGPTTTAEEERIIITTTMVTAGNTGADRRATSRRNGNPTGGTFCNGCF